MVDTNYKFNSQNITILRDKQIISSDEGATILDNLNLTRYEIGKFSYNLNKKVLKGENIFINTKYNQPFSDKYFFKSAVFNLKSQNYIAQDININFKKDVFGDKNNDPRFRVCPHLVKTELQLLIKGCLLLAKKMTNALHGVFKQIKLLTMKIKNKYYIITLY